MKLLIDGDIIRYRVGFAGEKTTYKHWDLRKDRAVALFENAKLHKQWVKEHPEYDTEDYERRPVITVDPLENVLHSVKMVMSTIQDKYPDGEVMFYFSCPTEENWRYGIYPEYKANRPDRKPHWANEIQAYIQDKWPTSREPHFEADDLIAMAAAWCRQEEEDYVVVTIDKDMDQIPGLHFNWVKGEEYDIDWDTALYKLYTQVIAGDNTDNIKGVPGWGEVTAQEWLNGMRADDSWWYRCIAAYNEVYKDPYESEYQMTLTEALVTLPTCLDEQQELVEGVTLAKEAFEESQANREGDSPRDGNPGEPVLPEPDDRGSESGWTPGDVSNGEAPLETVS